MHWDRQNQFVIAGISLKLGLFPHILLKFCRAFKICSLQKGLRYSRVRYSRVPRGFNKSRLPAVDRCL